MAKQNKATAKDKTGGLKLQNRSIWFSDLQYIKPELKNSLWAAQNIYFAKKNARLFLDPRRAKEYRALDILALNEQVYKQMVDPITPLDGGGTATYFSADWQANPIYLHLKNIVKAELQRTAKQLEVNLTDKLAPTRRMRENYRIIYKDLFRETINEYAELVGLPKLTNSQDPFKWAKSFYKNQQGGEESNEQGTDIVTKYIDLIRNQIQDDQDLALYNELIYKGDYEIAFEKGIEHYLVNQNEWQRRHSDTIIDNIMHFNKSCNLWYTDKITGRPVIEAVMPEYLWVSPFKQKDGEDLMYYFYEWLVTFGDFVKMMGGTLTPVQLKAVFEYNKTQGSAHGIAWQDSFNRVNTLRDNAMIRIGRMSVLSQDYDVNMDDVIAPPMNSNTDGLSWETGAGRPVEIETDQRHYNVWYSWYYIPPTTNSLSNADYAWQAQFIFNIEKNQDQFRTGEQGRYCKSPLVIYDNSNQASFTDVVQAYMPKINNLWHQYQNCIINDVEAVILAEEFLGGMLGAVDEDNKLSPDNPNAATGGNGRDVRLEQWKMIKQGGSGFLKMTDKQGNLILDPSKLMIPYKNGLMDKAVKCMEQMLLLYDQLTKALARGSASEGEDVKPRTTVSALQETLKSSDNGKWYIEKAYEEVYKMNAERVVQYILMCARESKEYGYTKRWDEFKDVVGLAYGLTVEGLEDIPPESIGLTVNYVDNTAKKDFIMQLALQYVKQQQLDNDILYLIMGCDNWKVAFCMVRMGINQRKREQAAKEELDYQRQVQLQQQQLQIAQTLQGFKTQGTNSNLQTQGQIDANLIELENHVKAQNMQLQKQQLLQNKLTEQENKAVLEKNAKQQEPFDLVAGA